MNDATFDRRDGAGSTPTWAWCALVFVVAFAWMLGSGAIFDDQFNRIARGWHIWAYGESPFRDFRDPGYNLTLYASAAMQAVSGGSLLGEAMLDCGAIAVAVVLTFLMVVEVSRSATVGLVAVALMLSVAPRYYDYDKVLFYALGVLCCWRYIDRPSASRAVAAGVVAATAGLFRYDNGLVLAAAFLATLVACRRHDRRAFVRESAAYVIAMMLAVLPFLIAWQSTIGLPEVWRQVTAYAAQEGARSPLLEPLTIVKGIEPFLAWIYAGSILLLPVVAGSLAFHRQSDETFAKPVPKMLATLVVSGLVAAVVLRNPIGARLGAAVPTATILAAYLVGRWVPRRHLTTLSPRSTALAIVTVAVVVAGVRAARTLDEPSVAGISRRVVGQAIGAIDGHIDALAAAPRGLTALPDRERYQGLVEYLRDCTPAGSRVLTTWFAPHLHFFAQRGFAGGMVVFLGQPWTSAVDQARTVEQLESQDVSMALVESRRLAEFNADYDRVAGYLERHYRLAGVSSFSEPDAGRDTYRVLIPASTIPDHTDARWNLPCLVAPRSGTASRGEPGVLPGLVR